MPNAAKNSKPKNAFERAEASILALRLSWWETVINAIKSGEIDATISDPEIIDFGEGLTLGRMLLERRTITRKLHGKKKTSSWAVSRPIPYRFSALPLADLAAIAKDIYDHSQEEWRQANIANLIEYAQSYNRAEALDQARDILGNEASSDELEDFADQLRPPEALQQGGDAAADFFDKSVSRCDFDENEDGTLKFNETSLPPGIQPFGDNEWDYYSADEVAQLDGPHSDCAYAFRVIRLSEAVEANSQHSVTLAMQLGAVAREWEIWRENEEFILKGREHFSKQLALAKSKPVKAWMNRVNEDYAQDKIGNSNAAYARKISRDRSLDPPSVDTIKNYVSKMKRQGRAISEER
jgi:hypothetical protein